MKKIKYIVRICILNGKILINYNSHVETINIVETIGYAYFKLSEIFYKSYISTFFDSVKWHSLLQLKCYTILFIIII